MTPSQLTMVSLKRASFHRFPRELEDAPQDPLQLDAFNPTFPIIEAKVALQSSYGERNWEFQQDIAGNFGS